MKIRIIDIKDDVVTFATNFGAADAVWNGEVPQVGNEYFVEIEIEGVLKWGVDLVESESNIPIITNEADKTYINGCLESVDDDGYTVIRLEENIICLETEGKVTYQEGTFIKIYAGKIFLYNIEN